MQETSVFADCSVPDCDPIYSEKCLIKVVEVVKIMQPK